MGVWAEQQLRAFIEENKLAIVQDTHTNALKDLFAETLQKMINTEMNTRRGYYAECQRALVVKKHQSNAPILKTRLSRSMPRLSVPRYPGPPKICMT